MDFRFKPIIIFLGLYSISFTANSTIQVPKGFEELAQGQVILTDVSIYGQSLGVFKSKVDLEKITFVEPRKLVDEIVKRYPGNSELKSLLLKKMAEPFNRNSQLACASNGNRLGCDYLDTNSIGVIYDENNTQVDLFISQSLLPRPKNSSIFFNESLGVQNALIHQQSINFVADRKYQSVSVQGDGTIGVTPGGYFNIDWDWQGQRSGAQSTHDIYANNAYFRQDFLKRFYLQIGVMDARDIFSNIGGNINLSQLPLGKIRGIRAGSTLAWVDTDKSSKGTPVNIFLSRESRVDAYRDGQLLTTFYLKAGAQTLNTQSFPQGSYTVTLRIYEDNQLVRTENVPYTGLGGSLPSELQWFAQAGVPYADGLAGNDVDKHVFQAGISVPLKYNFTLTSGAAFFSTAHYWEGAIDWAHGFNSGWIDGVLTSRASYLHGNEGSRGNMQQINYNDGFSLSFYRSAMTAIDCNSQGLHRYSINGCYKSTNAMLSVPMGKWYATLGYAQNKNRGRYVYQRDITDFAGSDLVVPWERIYQTRSESQTWQTGVTRTLSFDSVNITSSINAFVRNDSTFNSTDKGMFFTLSFSSSRDEVSGKRRTYSGGANWQTSKQGSSTLAYNLAANQYYDDTGENETGIALSGINSSTLTSSLYGRAGGQYGTGSLTLSDSWDRKAASHLLNASGNYSSSFVLDRDGLAMGRWGDGTPSSAITVSVDQNDSSDLSKVNVSVDTSGRSEVHGNSRAIFAMPGYRKSQLDITESGSANDGTISDIRRGTGSKTVFMAPGKVFNRSITVEVKYTWLGRLVDDKGRPLDGSVPLNVVEWTRLGNGNYTFDTTQKISTLYLASGESYWSCAIKVRTVRDVIRYIGESRCQRTNFSGLPEIEQELVKQRANNADTVAMNN